MSISDRLDEIEARADKAATLVGALAAGTAEWRMRVPVHDDDSDVVLMGTAEDCEKTVAALRAVLNLCDKTPLRYQTPLRDEPFMVLGADVIRSEIAAALGES